MFDLVPFAGSWGKMANAQSQAQVIGKLLQGHFPQSRTVAVAAASVRGDQEFARPRKTFRPHVLPPTLNRSGGKLSRVTMNANADPALIVRQIINSIANGFPQSR